jgi:hypothetical protein
MLSTLRPKMQLTLPDDRYRRLAGLLLGAVLGLVLGLVTQFADRLALPGVPLYQPPFGPAGNALAVAAGGALFGLLVSWLQSGLAGSALAALVSAVILLLYSFLWRGDASVGAGKFFFTSIFLIAPLWGMLVPLVGALRWAAGNIEEAHRDRMALRTQMWRPVLLLITVIGAGLLLRDPPRSRSLLLQTHEMLQAGQAAMSHEMLPPALRTASAGDFLRQGQSKYELSWEGVDIERYRIPRPGRNFNMHSVVVARFEDGWNLVCLYIVSDESPMCQGMTALPR